MSDIGTLEHSKAWGEVAAITERFLGDQLVEPHRTMVNMVASKLAERDETIRSLRSRVEWQPIETAPRNRFILVWCPEDGTRWLVKWQGGNWYGVDELGLTRTGMGPDDVTGWAVTLWCELPPPPLQDVEGERP